ncbi:aldo/keto reductase [Streptomyces xanthophaeus]|uniref:aldo/keto reductase n=1 Tax=Streptomyces xanthophaeus TaxID=67385 RepID=UPI00386A281B|nr:aldo/keto reductase [Streptomyces xanthophaeus]WST63862.1 aldo/keto reductase [Streptomyces xanthophaeus]
MIMRSLGASGILLPEIGLGTWNWGREVSLEEARACLHVYLDAGGSLLDTAASYSAGASEEFIGSLVRKGLRDRLVIATKAGVDPRTKELDVSRRAMLHALDASLRRLGTGHVDLWQVHAWSDAVGLDETLSALETAVATGRARHVGLCNYPGEQVTRAWTWQREHAAVPLVSVQAEYSLLRRGIEQDTLPAAARAGMGLLAWSPLAGGALTGKYGEDEAATTGTRADSPHYAGFSEHYLEPPDERRVVEAVRLVARAMEVPAGAVALAWLRERPGVVSALVGARNAAQLRDSLTACAVHLPDELAQALDAVSAAAPEQAGRSGRAGLEDGPHSPGLSGASRTADEED